MKQHSTNHRHHALNRAAFSRGGEDAVNRHTMNDMIKASDRVKAKLKSESGASITFALLIFLVCAVVGSVLLTAGTAASGRMSELARMDQRYYAVTSAAELLRDLLENETVTVVKTSPLSDSSGSGETKYYINGQVIDATGASFDSIAKAAAYDYLVRESAGSSTSLKLEVNGEGSLAPLSVDIQQELGSDGTLTFSISSIPGDRGGSGSGNDSSVYTMKISFTADVVSMEGTNAQTDTRTETKKVTWRLSDLTTVG